MRACRSCHRITTEEVCPVCKSLTSQHWSGYIGIIDPENSEIAKRMNIRIPGEYAIKVR